jgi:hypothetical protein
MFHGPAILYDLKRPSQFLTEKRPSQLHEIVLLRGEGHRKLLTLVGDRLCTQCVMVSMEIIPSWGQALEIQMEILVIGIS